MTKYEMMLLLLTIMTASLPNVDAEFGRIAQRRCFSQCLIAHSDCRQICLRGAKTEFARCYISCVREDRKCNQMCGY
ncbi:hypothetical protein LSAT2_003280 [Lamellibrachia satsuma]|nr:hypothetical protein LSAT2_003280 [Lamellibrachia satsuma]